MILHYADPFDTLFAFQQSLENRLSSGWLGSGTAAMGSFPPINVFQQGDDLDISDNSNRVAARN